EAFETLQDSIEFASRILPIDTEGVEPLYSVLEREKLALRPDTVTDGDRQAEVLQNAAVTEEEYFVAPPGNIPLEQGERMARTSKTWIELLDTCRRSKFLDFRLDGASVRDLTLAPVGQLLRNNLRTEWNQQGNSNSPSNAAPIFAGRSDHTFAENLLTVQRANGNKMPKLPFGVTVEETQTCKLVKLGANYTLELPEALVLRTTYLLPPQTGNPFLYRLQRQRKIWWMRLSVDPGRYFISDMRRDEAGPNPLTASVSICARFLDRTEDVAEVELERLELAEGGEKVGKQRATVVHVEHSLDRAVLAILMDALECTASEHCVKIHRKIAPFKCAIIGLFEKNGDTNVWNDLIDLSKHLTYVLRAANLSVLDSCSSDWQQQPPQAQLNQPHHRHLPELDQIGVPYALILRAETLRTGLLQLRSRDTTLSETIHLSDLPQYLERIINA
uniref:Anticodon-binding domain-containing protein n=1 Tax=Anopheles epiroticus TaxID=199890 RepID=A0A182PPW3_9DIPT